jgi:tetratricopeptide (TPR) repeat protein
MADSDREIECLVRARAAVKQNNASAMQLYYALFLSQFPEQGGIFSEYLAASRKMYRGEKRVMDVAAESALSRIFGAQNSSKVLDACLEKLKLNPFDLDAVYRAGRAAQSEKRQALVIAAFDDLMKAGTPGVQRVAAELRIALGRAHFQLKQYKASLDYLKGFQGDIETPGDILQMIKDASAHVASVPFQQHQTSFKIATGQSVVLSSQSAQEREQDEICAAERAVNDCNLEYSKRIAAALHASELHARSRRFSEALAALTPVTKADEFNVDLETRRLDIRLRQMSASIESLETRAKLTAPDKAELERHQIARDNLAATGYAELVAHKPTDGTLHLRCAESLYSIWKRSADEKVLKAAIEHLQVDFKSDELINRSRSLLAECFIGLGLVGTAEIVLLELIQRLEQRSKEADIFLEAQYLLGVVRERAENPTGATIAYMTIVSRNIRYKDAFDRLRKLEDRKTQSPVAKPTA